jgi:hypothetical protein
MLISFREALALETILVWGSGRSPSCQRTAKGRSDGKSKVKIKCDKIACLPTARDNALSAGNAKLEEELLSRLSPLLLCLLLPLHTLCKLHITATTGWLQVNDFVMRIQSSQDLHSELCTIET